MHIHKWGKWKQYEQPYTRRNFGFIEIDPWLNPLTYYELREERQCTICGKTQNKKVRMK